MHIAGHRIASEDKPGEREVGKDRSAVDARGPGSVGDWGAGGYEGQHLLLGEVRESFMNTPAPREARRRGAREGVLPVLRVHCPFGRIAGVKYDAP